MTVGWHPSLSEFRRNSSALYGLLVQIPTTFLSPVSISPLKTANTTKNLARVWEISTLQHLVVINRFLFRSRLLLQLARCLAETTLNFVNTFRNSKRELKLSRNRQKLECTILAIGSNVLLQRLLPLPPKQQLLHILIRSWEWCWWDLLVQVSFATQLGATTRWQWCREGHAISNYQGQILHLSSCYWWYASCSSCSENGSG